MVPPLSSLPVHQSSQSLLSVQYTPLLTPKHALFQWHKCLLSRTVAPNTHTHVQIYIHTYMHACIHTVHTYTWLWPLLDDVRGMLGIQRLHGWPYVLAMCSVRLWYHFKCMTVLERLWLLCASYGGSALQHLMGRLCV